MDRVASVPAVHPADVAPAGALLLEHAVAMTPAQIATAGQDLVEKLSRVADVDDPAEQAAVEPAAEQAEREAQHGERNELRLERRVGGRLRGRFGLGPLGEAALLAWLKRADRPVPGSDLLPDGLPGDDLLPDGLLPGAGRTEAGAGVSAATLRELRRRAQDGRDHQGVAGDGAAGGPTDLDNGVALCGFHHRMVHRQGWTVRLARSSYAEFLPPASIDPERRPPSTSVSGSTGSTGSTHPDRAGGCDPLGTRHRE